MLSSMNLSFQTRGLIHTSWINRTGHATQRVAHNIMDAVARSAHRPAKQPIEHNLACPTPIENLIMHFDTATGNRFSFSISIT